MCNPERYAAQPQPCLSVKLNLVNQQLHTEGGSAERGLNWISGSGFVGLVPAQVTMRIWFHVTKIYDYIINNLCIYYIYISIM